jgi:uncharacterized DUF497 family protein
MTSSPHPSLAEAWEWDEGNESELARHGISATEAEEVWENGPKFAPNVKHRAGAWKMMGLTNGDRPLTIIVRLDPVRLTLRPITGWRITKAERARYFKKEA